MERVSKRVVLVHERFTERGGSEHVVGQFTRLWPEARVFAPIGDREVASVDIGDTPLSFGAMQRLYRGDGRYAHLLPLLPRAMARADLGDADLVITSHHAFANRVRSSPGTPVISYTHSPARWIWDSSTRQGEMGGRLGAATLGTFAATQRKADKRAAGRLTGIVANSTAVADRVARWWGRDSIVVPPPVDVDRFALDPEIARDDFFLVAGRLVPYKRADVAIAAARQAGARIVVAGNGRFRSACEAVAGPGVEFVGEATDVELRELFQRCRALVFPGEEDFGIVPVEAQACGAPVLALDAGGARDSVVDGVTGSFVSPVSDAAAQITAFAGAMTNIDWKAFDSDAIRANAERFSTPRFHARMKAAVDHILSQDSPANADLRTRAA